MTLPGQWSIHLPPGWSVKPLKYAAQMNSEVLPESTDPEYAFEYIDISNVDERGELISLQQLRFKDAPSRARRVVGEGDTLISTVRTYLRAIHFVSRARPDLIASTGFAVLHPMPGILPEFLWRVLQSTRFVDQVVAHSDGVGYPAINPSTLGALPIWFAARAVQAAIVAFLRPETAKINALIEKKERLITLLEEKRAALINRAVTKGLDPNAPMKDSGMPWTGPIPAHWQVKRLKYAVPEITVGIVVTPAKYYVDEGVPCLRSLNISGRTIDRTDLVFISSESNELLSKSRIRQGDVLVVRTGKTGAAVVVPEDLDGANCIDLLLIRRSSSLVSEYLFYLLNSWVTAAQIECFSEGAIQAHYNTSTLAELTVTVPPVKEQQAIVEWLDQKMAVVDSASSKIREQIARFQEYRTALISAAVTGKIDVRESAGF